MDIPDYPSHLSSRSALTVYRGWLTWETLRLVAPQHEAAVAALDPGPREGFISIRSFRGSIVDRGAFLAAVIAVPGGISTTRHVSVEGSGGLKAALFEALAWAVTTAGTRSPDRSVRTNTGSPYISVTKSSHSRPHLRLSTPTRRADGAYAPFRVQTGPEDSPAFADLHEAGFALMERVVADERERRPFRGAIDRAYWTAEWRSISSRIREKWGVARNGYFGKS